MANLKRAIIRQRQREDIELNKPFTTTKKAILQLAQQEADKFIKEQKRAISDDITNAIALQCGYLLASSLEAKHGFGKKRSADTLIMFIGDLVSLCEKRCNIEDHIKYWNDKGLHIEEGEGGKLIVRTD